MSVWRVARDDEPVNAWRNESPAISECRFEWVQLVPHHRPMTDKEYEDGLAALSGRLLREWLDLFYSQVGAA